MDENAMIFSFKSTSPGHMTFTISMKVQCLKRIYAQITHKLWNKYFYKIFCHLEGTPWSDVNDKC